MFWCIIRCGLYVIDVSGRSELSRLLSQVKMFMLKISSIGTYNFYFHIYIYIYILLLILKSWKSRKKKYSFLFCWFWFYWRIPIQTWGWGSTIFVNNENSNNIEIKIIHHDLLKFTRELLWTILVLLVAKSKSKTV